LHLRQEHHSAFGAYPTLPNSLTRELDEQRRPSHDLPRPTNRTCRLGCQVVSVHGFTLYNR
jgi:hypothetical protein